MGGAGLRTARSCRLTSKAEPLVRGPWRTAGLKSSSTSDPRIQRMLSNVICNVTLTEEVQVFLKVAYIPVFVVGLSLNALALYAFFLRRASWTDTHVYMINLAVADLAVILFLPFKIHDVFNQPDASVLCTVVITTRYLNMYVSVFTVAAISVHRFVAVRFPFHARARGSRKVTALAVCVLIWAVVATTCAVFRKEFYPGKMQSCSERKPTPLPLHFMLVLLIAGFLLPFCTMLLCSSQTIVTLLKEKGASPHREEKIKSIAIITANMIVFIVCYTPFHIVLLIKNIEQGTVCRTQGQRAGAHLPPQRQAGRRTFVSIEDRQ
ncbi:hypothetical protein AAFF_G00237500 [Aldrovandia affinis]|uniref:G-protein coupled receptors family 1 profile domain-containing protein n=1 Tax=Aldrovandia affinis TaxID=143900 RepID=A0AAD7REP1_9TELE|nr:hypothetical protein AAFF_G00237500 [Aldrovandia affinis]